MAGYNLYLDSDPLHWEVSSSISASTPKTAEDSRVVDGELKESRPEQARKRTGTADMADVNNTGHDINGTNNNDENRSNKKRDGAGDMDDGTAENTTHAPADDGEEEEEDNSPRVFFDALHRRVLLLKPWRPNVLFISKKMDSTSAKRYRNRHRDAQDQSKTNHRPSPTDPQGDGVSHASTQQQQQQNQSSLLTSSLAAVASASSGWTELQLDLKGAENPLDIKLSSDKSLVAIRVCDKEVRVLSASTGHVVASRSCRGSSGSMLDIVWMSLPQPLLLFVTSMGVELYLMYKRKLRHLRTQQFNIAYHWYLPERNILLLVDQHNVFQAFRLTNKTIAKVCKFELSCSKTSFGFFLQSVSLSSSRTGKGKNRNLHPAVQAQAQAQQQQLLNSANQKRSDQPHDSYGSSSSGNGVSRHSHHHNTHNKDSESDRSPDAPEAPILGFCSRQISMWRIYESTIIIFINERKGRMHIFTLTNDTMEQSYVYDLHSPGKYFLSLVDHVLIAHNTTLNLSTIFDIRSNSKANLVPPSPIFHPLVSVNTDSILSQSNYTNNRDNNNDKNKKNNDTHENNDIDSNGTHGNEAYCRNDGVSYEHGRFVAPHFYFEKDSRDARDASTTRTYHYNKKRAGGKTEGEGRGKQYTNGGGTGGDGRMGMDMDMDTPGQGRFYTLKLDLTQIGQAWEANKQTRLVDFLLKRRSLLAKNLIFALVRRKLAAGGSLALLSKIFSILNRVCYNAYVTSGKVGLYAAVTSTQYTGSQPSSHQPSPSSSGTSTPSHTRSSGSSSSSHSSTPQFHSSSSRHQHHAQSSRRQLVHDQTPNTHTQYPRNYTPDHDDDDDLNSNHNNDYTSKLGDGLLSVFRSPYGDGDDGEGGGDGDGAAGSSYLSPAELAHKRLKAHILHFYGNQHYALDARTIEHTESGYTVITQEQMYQHVFLPLFVSAFISPTPSSSAVSAAATSGENTGCGVNIHGAGNSSSGCDGDDDDDKGGDRINNPRPTAAVLVPALAEYLRSIYRHYMSTEDFLNDLLVDLFIIDKRYYEFHQYLQYHILNDSTTIATKLLQLSDCYLSAYQLGIDMIYRLNAFDLLLSSLLERREIVTALQLIPYRSPLFTRPGLKPCDFLAAARQKNICTFYSAFKFFEARNIVLRHSPEFPVEEGCSHFAVEFQTLFADFALQSSTLPSPLTALHPGSVEYSPPSSTVSSLSVSVTSTSPHADGNGGRDDSGGNIGGSYASERVDNDDNANKDGSGDKGATTASDVGGKSVSDGNLGDVSGTSDSPMKDSQVVDESAADGTNADTEERRAAEEEDKVHETVASTRKDRDADSAAIMADTNGYGLDADAKTDVKVDNLRERLGDFDIDEDDSSEYYYDDEDEAYE